MPPTRGSAARGRTHPLNQPPGLALAALAGASGLHLLPELPPYWLYLAGLVLAVPAWRGRWLCAIALASAAWSHWHAAGYLRDRWPEARYGEEQWVNGWVAGLPERETGRTRFLFESTDGHQGLLHVNYYDAARVIRAGDCHRFLLRLRPPRGVANPGGFDVEGWAYRERITAMAYVRGEEACTAHVRDPRSSMRAGLLRLRAYFAGWIDQVLGPHPQRGVVAGLTIGDDHEIDDKQWNTLRRTGTIHLISISGLHIALVAGLVFIVVRRAWSTVPVLTLRVPSQRAGAAAGILAALAYAALAGFSIPTQRSLIMSALALGALGSARIIAPARVLALALIAVLAWEPAAVMSPGFWLSFLAVAWIAFLLRARLQSPGRLMLWIGLQLALAAALAPIVLFVFGETSLSSPLANLIMIPAYSLLLPALLLVVLAGAAGMPGCDVLLRLLAEAMEWLWHVIEWLGASSVATWDTAQVSLWATCMAMLGLLLLLAPRGWPLRLAGACCCLPMLWPTHAASEQAAFDLTLLDVGQGLSAVVRTSDHTLLFDTGPAGMRHDAATSVILPYLRWAGIAQLDAVVVSHGDMDHRGGLPALLANHTVIQHWGAAGGEPCRRGSGWTWDGVEFRFLHPDRAEWLGNDQSCVLSIRAGAHRALLTGDIGEIAEQYLVGQQATELGADLLVLAHHGSASSSSPAFLQAVRPRLALIPAGWHNRYRHPSPRVLKRLAGYKIPWLDTAEVGAISVRIDARHGLGPPRTWRGEQNRFWLLQSKGSELAAAP